MATYEIKSELTGVVFELSAEVGAQVSEDEVVLYIESMKMEAPVASPVSGKLAKYLVAVGDQVETGAVLAELEV